MRDAAKYLALFVGTLWLACTLFALTAYGFTVWLPVARCH